VGALDEPLCVAGNDMCVLSGNASGLDVRSR
jgi:hypothetical protein